MTDGKSGPSGGLWISSFLAAILFHGVILAGAALWRPAPKAEEPPAAVMMVALVLPGPAPVPPSAPASAAPEPPQPKAVEPSKAKPRPLSKPRADLIPESVPEPVAKPADGPAGAEKPASSFPPAPQAAGAVPTARTAAENAARDTALSVWRMAIRQHLERRKRYPDQARVRRQEGEAMVRFTMTRDGRVTAAELARGSGHAALDREVLALPERAQPLPPPPADVAGERIEIVIPIQFSLR